MQAPLQDRRNQDRRNHDRTRRETWITGLGIVSCLGEGPQAHWQKLNEAPQVPASEAFAPTSCTSWRRSTSTSRSPRRRPAPDGRVAAHRHYAAGLALDSAGAKGNADLLSRMT